MYSNVSFFRFYHVFWSKNRYFISRSSLGFLSVIARSGTTMLHQGGRGYPVHRFPIAIRLRDRKGRAIQCIALNPHYGDSSGASPPAHVIAAMMI